MGTGIRRRQFLQRLTASALLMTPAGRALALPAPRPGADWLSFSRESGIGPPLGEAALDGALVPLHRETRLALDSVDPRSYRQLVALVAKLMDRHQKSWQEDAPLLWTYQHFGRSGKPEQSRRLLSYARDTQDFLHARLRGLPELHCHWRLLEEQTEAMHPGPCNGLVGRHNYLVHHVNAVDAHGHALEPGLMKIEPVERAINYIVDGHDHSPRSSTIYLIHGQTALVAPFTELIHLHTHRPSLQYADQLSQALGARRAQRLGRLYGETLTEAAGIVMAQRFLDQYGQGDNRIYRQLAAHAASRYPALQRTMALMHRDGLQRTLRQYLDDPAVVMKKIGARTAP